MNRLEIRFSFFGIPVHIEPGFWLIAILFGVLGSAQSMLVMAALVFVGVFVHELGHASVSKAFGARPEITLYTLGGLTRSTLPEGKHFTRAQSALVTFAGPMAGFLLGGATIAYLLMAHPHVDSTAFAIATRLLWINIGWGLLNLLPLLPLDGGNLVRVALSGPGPEIGFVRALWVTVIVGPLAALAAVALSDRFIPLLCAFLTFSAGRQLLTLRRIRADRSQGLDGKLDSAHDALVAGDLDRTRDLASLVAQAAKTSELRAGALHLLAVVNLEQGAPQQAIAHLEQLDPEQTDPFLYGACLLALDRPGEAVPYLERALGSGHHPRAVELLIKALDASGDKVRADQLRNTPHPHPARY